LENRHHRRGLFWTGLSHPCSTGADFQGAFQETCDDGSKTSREELVGNKISE
jgi:hypothetical protein